jgi:hypothetical protein
VRSFFQANGESFQDIAQFEMLCASFVLASFIVFLATAFRPTRFLGEPERYVESVNAFAILASLVFLLQHQWIWIWIMSGSISLVLLSMAIQITSSVTANSVTNQRRALEVIREQLLKFSRSMDIRPRVLSNDINSVRSMFSSDIEIVYSWSPFKLGQVPFDEAVEPGRKIKLEFIPQIADYYAADFLVLNSDDLEVDVDALAHLGLSLREVCIVGRFGLYAVDSAVQGRFDSQVDLVH